MSQQKSQSSIFTIQPDPAFLKQINQDRRMLANEAQRLGKKNDSSTHKSFLSNEISTSSE